MRDIDKKKIDMEWAKYKYCVMEKSYKQYKTISRNIATGNYQYEEFLCQIQKILNSEDAKSQIINTVYHIWGYFKRIATEEEKRLFFTKVNQYKEGTFQLKEIKQLLYQYAVKYKSDYLLNSYYFNDLKNEFTKWNN